jgi:hypothetical protein
MKILVRLLLILALFAITHVEAKYKRSTHFGHWKDFDKDCQNTRHEVLIDKSLVPVKMMKKGCKVNTGKWVDFYDGKTIYIAKKIDIDHVVPLKEAYLTGAMSWSKKKRVQFANDPDNLVVTHLKINRSKSDRTPREWLPLDRSYACKFMKKWIAVKKKWNLKIHKNMLSETNKVCNGT